MRILILVSLFFISCTQTRQEKRDNDDDAYFNSIAKNDIDLKTPVSGEWRYSYHEDKQSFSEYKKINPKRAQFGVTKLYLLPIGNFSNEQTKVLESTREYLEIFFQLQTKILKPISDAIIPDTAKRLRTNKNIQLFTPYIFANLLKGKIPAEGYALMAISEKDLYPRPDWNFVFGIASYKDRIGVSSIFRLQNGTLDSSNYLMCLRRLLNTASHEIGHMFSIHHCNFAECVMNGSNSLNESDRQPVRMCSECQKKLHWNIQYDNKKRLIEIVNYLKANRLKEDLFASQQDYISVK